MDPADADVLRLVMSLMEVRGKVGSLHLDLRAQLYR